MDRGYNDYSLLGSRTGKGVYFMTRLKDNAVFEIIKMHDPKGRNVLADYHLRLTGAEPEEKCRVELLLVIVWDTFYERALSLLTNHLEFGASTIAAIYKDRRQIEIFFKTLEQKLKVKSFVGTSNNALRIQVRTALIAMLRSSGFITSPAHGGRSPIWRRCFG